MNCKRQVIVKRFVSYAHGCSLDGNRRESISKEIRGAKLQVNQTTESAHGEIRNAILNSDHPIISTTSVVQSITPVVQALRIVNIYIAAT